ncbi:nadh-ubiquinone oxidoreductase, partial [Lasius niger]
MKSITRTLENFKKLEKAKKTRAVVQYRINLLHEQFAKVQDLDVELYTAADETLRTTNAYFKEDHLLKCEGDYHTALDIMHE